MGHDIRFHREYYRLPQSTLEVAKVSKILHLLNTGRISEVAGADLDDIDVTAAVEIEELSDVETPDGEDQTGKKKASELDLKQKDLDVDDENDPDWIASKDKIDSSSDDDDDDDIGECQSRSIKHIRKKIDSSDDETDDYGYAETKKKQRKKGKKIGKRSTWTTEENQCVECAFQKDILLKRIPGKKNNARSL